MFKGALEIRLLLYYEGHTYKNKGHYIVLKKCLLEKYLKSIL